MAPAAALVPEERKEETVAQRSTQPDEGVAGTRAGASRPSAPPGGCPTALVCTSLAF